MILLDTRVDFFGKSGIVLCIEIMKSRLLHYKKMKEKYKKLVFVGMNVSPEMEKLLLTLSRNGFECVTLEPPIPLVEMFVRLRIKFREYNRKHDKISLAIIEPKFYVEYCSRFKKCPILADVDDFEWYIDQIGSSHDGRLSLESFNWLRMKVIQMNNHISLMEFVESHRPKKTLLSPMVR